MSTPSDPPVPPRTPLPVRGGEGGTLAEPRLRSLAPALRSSTWVSRLRWAWPALAILAAYVIPLLIVRPTLHRALIDDWNYQLSVRHLVNQHQLWVAPWTAATLVFQIFWGALFAWPFGVGPIALRISTLVASFGGTLATYGLCRELEVTPRRAVIGGLAVWFNPITFSLSYTFMTDVPYLALMTAAIYAIVRASRRGSLGLLVVGSTLAGLAFLVRQQGILIPLAAFAWFLVTPPRWFRARPYRASAALLGPCLLAVQEYYLWIWSRGMPATQGDYFSDIRRAGWSGTLDLSIKIAIVGLFFVGLFILPITIGSLAELPVAWRRASNTWRGGIMVGFACLILWTRWYYVEHNGRSFPFIPWGGMIHEDGLGVLDSVGVRPFFFTNTIWLALGILCALSAAAGAVLIAGGERGVAPAATGRTPSTSWLAGLVGAFGVGQFLGVIPPSLHIIQFITFDRYFIPLLPLAVALVLWSLRGFTFVPGIALAVLVLLGVVNLLGVQDWFAFKQVQWETAAWLVNDQGIAANIVDGGPQWDGLHFYEYSLSHPYDRVARQPNDVWWLWLIAPNIDPVYVVAASPTPPPNYTLYAKRPYHSWVRSKAVSYVYVWRRNYASAPVSSTAPTPSSSGLSDLPLLVKRLVPSSLSGAPLRPTPTPAAHPR